MNATATPISPAKTIPAKTAAPGSHFGTDAVYKGYDLMVRRFATHIIREARVGTASRADLVRAISSPMVTFAASASDGAILLCCPEGLPASLLSLAEAVDHPVQSENITAKLDQIEQRLATMAQDQGVLEHMSDRLEMLEHVLRERLDPAAGAEAAQGIDRRLDQLAGQIGAVLQAVTQLPAPTDTGPLERSLTEAEARLLTAIVAPIPAPDLSPVLQAVTDLTAQIAALPQPEETLARVETRLDDLASRPVPVPDMSVHHTALALAETNLGQIATRLDHAIGRLPDPDTLASQAQHLADLAAQITQSPAEVERRLVPHLDQTPILAALAAQTEATGSAVSDVATQLDALAARPELDLSGQTAGLESLSHTLTDLAQQISHLTDIATAGPDLSSLGQPAQSAELSAALLHLEAIAAKPEPRLDLGAQNQQLGQIALNLASLYDSQHSLQEALDAAAQRSDVAELAAALTSLSQRPEPVFDLTAVTHRLDDLPTQAQVSALVGGLQTSLALTAQDSTLATAFAELAAQVDHLVQRPQPDLDLSEHTASLQGLVTPLTTMAERFDSLAETVAQGPDLTVVQAGFDHLAAAIGQPAQEANLARTFAQVSQLAQRLDSLSDSLATGPDFTPLANQVAAGFAQMGQPAQNGSVLAALTDLAEQIAIVSERPDPVIDMTSQRTSFAQFGTALGLAVQRLEAVAEIVGESTAAPVDLAPLLAKLDALRIPPSDVGTVELLNSLSQQIAALAQQIPQPDNALQDDLAALAGRIDEMFQSLAQTPDFVGPLHDVQATLLAALPADPAPALAASLSALSDQVSSLANRPDPVIDLSAHQQDFSRFASTLTEAVAHLREIGQQVASCDPGLAFGQITALQDDIAAQRREMISRPDLDELTHNIATLLARADVAPDVAEQKDHLAAFAKGMADLVMWLDPVSRDLAAGPDFGPILTEFDLLRRELNMPARDSAFEAAFTQLSDQIADLAKSPEGLVSLAEQRRGFASFSNALSFMLHRLDAIASGHPAPQGLLIAESEDGAALLERQIQSPAAPPPHNLAELGNTLSALVLRMEGFLSQLSQTPPEPQAEPAQTEADADEAGAGAEKIVDPAHLIDNLALATKALADVVDILETETGLPQGSPAATVSVSELFDRLDAALDVRDLRGLSSTPALAAALHSLTLALRPATPGAQPASPDIGALQYLRMEFAELVARALQHQASTPD